MSGLSGGTRDILFWHAGSVVAACRLCSPLARGILVPRPEIEPASPVLEGRFLTTGPPRNSPDCQFSEESLQVSGGGVAGWSLLVQKCTPRTGKCLVTFGSAHYMPAVSPVIMTSTTKSTSTHFQLLQVGWKPYPFRSHWQK